MSFGPYMKFSLLDEADSVFNRIFEQISLLKELQWTCHLIKSNWPVLPFLIFSQIDTRFGFLKVISPWFADKDAVASQSLNKLLVPYQFIVVFREDFKLIAIAASLVNWKCSPIIVTEMKLWIVFLLVPLSEFLILFCTFSD